MPAKSKAQQRFMGMVRSTQEGNEKAPSKEVADAAKSISKEDAEHFAATKTKGLPEHVEKKAVLIKLACMLLEKKAEAIKTIAPVSTKTIVNTPKELRVGEEPPKKTKVITIGTDGQVKSSGTSWDNFVHMLVGRHPVHTEEKTVPGSNDDAKAPQKTEKTPEPRTEEKAEPAMNKRSAAAELGGHFNTPSLPSSPTTFGSKPGAFKKSSAYADKARLIKLAAMMFKAASAPSVSVPGEAVAPKATAPKAAAPKAMAASTTLPPAPNATPTGQKA